MASNFYIRKQVNGQYYYTLTATNGEPILKGEGYTTKQNCINGINSVKVNAPYDSRYERKTSISGTYYYFVLKAANGEPIGVGEMYNSTAARENGISSVKNNAPTAPIVDLT